MLEGANQVIRQRIHRRALEVRDGATLEHLGRVILRLHPVHARVGQLHQGRPEVLDRLVDAPGQGTRISEVKRQAVACGLVLEEHSHPDSEGVVFLLANGRWELGAHSATHANLPTLDQAEAFVEITGARKNFAAIFGATPMTFAYPFGLYSSRDAGLVYEAGYVAAMTTEPGIQSPDNWNLLELSRIKVSGKDSLFSFKLRINGGKRGLQK